MVSARSLLFRLFAAFGSALLFCGAASAQSERVFFGNLHSHTGYSDGSGTPREAYTHARDVGRLDFLALTEHNHAEAAGDDNISIALDPSLYKGAGSDSLISTANALTQNGRFVALYGQEYSTISSGNHVNVFDIGEVITVEKGRFDRLLTFLSTNRDTANQPAIMMLNHPENTFQVRSKEYGRDDFPSEQEWVRQMGAQARLIQLINGPGQVGGDDHRPANPDEEAFFKYLNLGFKVAPTADQDNHKKNWGTATPARTAVVATELTKASVLDALRKRHVYATEDKNLSVVIKVNGRLCGDVIAPLPPVGELSIEYRISDPDEPTADYTIEVFRDSVGGSVARMVTSVSTAAGGGTGAVQDVAFSGEAQYFFFKVIQFNEDGIKDRVWTAPVWFQSQPDTTPTPGGGGGGGQPARTDQAVASRRSNTFHVSRECLDAQRIRRENLVTGAQARRGRLLHQGCPRTTGPR